MHLLITDRLSCPRCGPGFGLILRADRMEDRQVLEGLLGCPNCRDGFPVVDGFADLRAPPRDEPGPGLVGPPPVEPTARDEGRPGPEGSEVDEDEAMRAERLVALLGVVGGPGMVALVGEPARLASEVAAALPELLVVAVDADLRLWPEQPDVSRLMSGPGLPLFDSSLRAIAVDGRLGSGWLAEAARVVPPRARVVVLHAPADVASALAAAGLRVLAEQGKTVVAARS